jgi:hypothetical protein
MITIREILADLRSAFIVANASASNYGAYYNLFISIMQGAGDASTATIGSTIGPLVSNSALRDTLEKINKSTSYTITPEKLDIYKQLIQSYWKDCNNIYGLEDNQYLISSEVSTTNIKTIMPLVISTIATDEYISIKTTLSNGKEVVASYPQIVTIRFLDLSANRLKNDKTIKTDTANTVVANDSDVAAVSKEQAETELLNEVFSLMKSIVRYEFQIRRYSQRRGQLHMPFNPNIMPGFPIEIEDTYDGGENEIIYGYVEGVRHTIDIASGNYTTDVEVSMIRTKAEDAELHSIASFYTPFVTQEIQDLYDNLGLNNTPRIMATRDQVRKFFKFDTYGKGGKYSEAVGDDIRKNVGEDVEQKMIDRYKNAATYGKILTNKNAFSMWKKNS